MVKKLLIIAALVGVVLWAYPEVEVGAQPGYGSVATSVSSAAFPLLAPDGSAAAPSYAFANGAAEGMYLAFDSIRFAVDGAQQLIIENDTLRFPNGTVGAPALAFGGDVDSGLYLVGVANVAMSVGGVIVQDWENTNAAGAGADLTTISSALGIMDGSDTVRGLFVDLTNADHTGSSNLLYGIDIDAITGDADASEYAINIGSGWDAGINGVSEIEMYVDGTRVTVQNDAPTQPKLLVSGTLGISGPGVKFSGTQASNFDGSDVVNAFEADITTSAASSGSGNEINAFFADGITGQANQTENLLMFGDGFEYFLNDEVDTALGTLTWTTNADKTGNNNSGTLKVYINGTLYHIQLYADS